MNRTALVTAIAAAVLVPLTPLGLVRTASASEPACVTNDDLTRSADGSWRLRLHAKCKDQSGVFEVDWQYFFWAEPQGGGEQTAAFVKPLSISRKMGVENLVELTAPGGYGRYCYDATATFKGLRLYQTPELTNRTGRHCKDT